MGGGCRRSRWTVRWTLAKFDRLAMVDNLVKEGNLRQSPQRVEYLAFLDALWRRRPAAP